MEKMGMSIGLIDPSFWAGKKVFLTGHTGFKGGWLSLWLTSMGAKVHGYALPPNSNPNLYEIFGIKDLITHSEFGDIRDLTALISSMKAANPEIVVHMAAQPLVRYSYTHPIETYEVNIMGTVNVLDSLRHLPCVRSVVIVTTDKCYENHERSLGYSEEEPMGGFDPYSSSKGCAELVTSAYRKSYFSSSDSLVAIATARAGNVIGGGDWSKDRLIPDAIKAFEAETPLLIRNPNAVRPWQHVLEPLSGYIVLAQALYKGGQKYASAWNFGPREADTRQVKDVINLLAKGWPGNTTWVSDNELHAHEASLLYLNCSKALIELNWSSRWSLETAVGLILEWQKKMRESKNMRDVGISQIKLYQNTEIL